MWYGSRWYDDTLGRFIQPDSIIPSISEGNNPLAIGYITDNNYSALVVNYHEARLLEQLNRDNFTRLTDSEKTLPGIPSTPLAFDRYAYAFNNPVRYIDPTGHSSTSPEDIGNWLRENIKVIWNTAPTWTTNLFDGKGRRIIMVDKPHPSVNFYHINSDLKLLKAVNHQNIEPILAKVAVVKTAVDTASASVVKSTLQIANSSTILLLERIPIFIIPIPNRWPYPTPIIT